jgi:hypothetical protein
MPCGSADVSLGTIRTPWGVKAKAAATSLPQVDTPIGVGEKAP